jgi:hypothetical protein
VRHLGDFLDRSSGKLVVLLAHIDDDDIVAKDPRGEKTLLRMKAVEVDKLAQEKSCDLILLGCSSAGAGPAVGVLQPFSTITAVERIDAALVATTRKDFIEKLACEKMSLVINQAHFSRHTEDALPDSPASDDMDSPPPEEVVGGRWTLKASIMMTERSEKEWTPSTPEDIYAGNLTISFDGYERINPPMPPPLPDDQPSKGDPGLPDPDENGRKPSPAPSRDNENRNDSSSGTAEYVFLLALFALGAAVVGWCVFATRQRSRRPRRPA